MTVRDVGAFVANQAQNTVKQVNREAMLAKAMNQQYVIVQDKLTRTGGAQAASGGRRAGRGDMAPSVDWAKLPQDKNKLPDERLINGDDSYYSKMQNDTLSTLDSSMFMRHGDIEDIDFKIRLDFLRDFKNKLSLLSREDEVVYREQLERDSTRQIIAKLAT